MNEDAEHDDHREDGGGENGNGEDSEHGHQEEKQEEDGEAKAKEKEKEREPVQENHEDQSKKGIINVGIDLGTSRSSISTSDGQKKVVRSYVGWPADMVAKKVLKKPILIGDDALANRVMLDLHRPLERGLIKEGSEKDLKAVRELLTHLLRLAGIKGGTKGGQPVRAVVGVPAEAMRVNKQQLRNTMSGIVDSLMIVSEPFAVAYGLEALLHSLIIDIGAGTADFCVMKGRYPTEEDQRTLTTAGDWVDDQLNQLIADRYPEVNFSEHMVREWKEAHAFVGDPEHPVKVTAPVRGKPTTIDITNELRTACESLIPPVTESMMELVAKVEPEYQEAVRNNVVLCGGSGLIKGMGPALEKALKEFGGGKVTLVEDPVFVGSDGGLAIARDAPTSDWEKIPAGG